ncbi:MAG TPA: TauD/TfdA family dioxygenase [Alphaproteobacteria bacterium]|nr:TauD/TfdA family dioxygenase [Alphaproteobacteria bacterium]
MNQVKGSVELGAGLVAVPLQPAIGAEVHGVDLRAPSVEQIAMLRMALLRYKVIFFRDQDITREQHLAFGRAFGALEVHPLASHPDFPELLPLISTGKASAQADFWHTDTTFRAEPSAASILRARTVPPLGGDTLWCNMVAVYEGLDAETRRLLDRSQAVHEAIQAFGRHLTDPQKRKALTDNFPPQIHPAVRVHPETGERALYVNSGFTTRILGLSETESESLLAILYDEVKRPEYQVRFRWAPHSIAFWDNRATQHYAVPDYEGQREMERVTIVGDRPVGPAATALTSKQRRLT